MALNDPRTAPDSRARQQRFTVHWMVSGRERRSARMTEIEAQRLVDRLTREKAEGVRMNETDDPVYIRFRPT